MALPAHAAPVCYWSVLLLGLTLALALPVARAAAAAAEQQQLDPRYVLVAGPPRAGTTWLFNAVRLLVRYHDPNVISGFETGFGDRDLCYWRAHNVSMVVKTHALHKGFMVGGQCAGYPGSNKGGTANVGAGGAAGGLVPGFDLAVTSFREPFGTGCSLVKKDGRVAANTCEKMLCEQHAFYHPPTVQLALGNNNLGGGGGGGGGASDGGGTTASPTTSTRPAMVYEMDFRDLTSGLELDILRDLAAALGVTRSLARAGGHARSGSASSSSSSSNDNTNDSAAAAETVLRLVAQELSLLRPLGDPVHSLRSAQHPVTLMHANHVGRQGSTACDADPGLRAMRANPLCHALAETHGRMTEQLWAEHRAAWQGKCARLRKLPQPQSAAPPAGQQQQKKKKTTRKQPQPQKDKEL